ncbi:MULTISPECIES: Rrf2 family transcriptional regulator [Shewanella]|jgi:Rrf2 family nitric oxide-sensitive transcriptional repressor|uniref:Rrf2 family transcriptional regulator n=1 Tax=Shewanella chilikensis TaxID=558541 RepID=A0A6G7LLV0_9GAMM|nr:MULTISPECIES: Rrf2 family transcriptional regulator [Shewanella]MBZ4680687.1 BadM/Rrf2 family transcriptional regulator [Shewanella sp.]MCA0950320.1 Rrf2 family transcriptional regulator [Shewanella chilikensis]MCE9851186.1 Rrf2 family transcriptional regulator [Shewanella chilikensis]MCL1153557.1 Rrf2 family transcriptional regulator [Shewanella chilikensis]PYE54290.1 BadM/Rrf2 family transcriptional regulator [Shewanella chilikensis]
MQLTRYTDFGIRTLMYLAIQPERETLFRIAEITEVFDLSPNHVSKIVHHLGKLGYLQTIRGKSGGFRLGMAPEKINVGELVRALENSLAPIDCSKPYCRLTPACQLKGVLAQAVDAYLAVLDRYTLADIVSNQQELRALLPDLEIPVLQL